MSDIVLVPGFWLGGWAWDRVAEPLRRRGHRVYAVTLPGLESATAPRAGIHLADHVAALADVIVSNDLHDVVLVAHSGGGTVAYGAIDRLPDRIDRAVYVDSGPLAEGMSVRTDVPAGAVELPLPAWSEVEATGSSTAGLSDADREEFRRRAVPHPAGPAREPAHLENERRRAVATTIVCCSFSSARIREYAAKGVPWFAELAHLPLTYVDLPTGHWPMLSRPAELAQILASIAEDVPLPSPA